ncbi:MAG: leucine-rich repeat protein [Clostridiales bacterium]|nr:leucine-rich repeat protein [Clostridiales bacterium]
MAEVKNTKKKPVAKKPAQNAADTVTENLEATVPEAAAATEQPIEQTATKKPASTKKTASTKKPAAKKSSKQTTKTTISEQPETAVVIADEQVADTAEHPETEPATEPTPDIVEQPVAIDEQKADESKAESVAEQKADEPKSENVAEQKEPVAQSEKPTKTSGKKFPLSKNMIIILSCVLAIVIVGVILAVCLTSCKGDNGNNKQYTVTFIVDGEVMTTYTLTAGETVKAPENNPTKEMHEFAGWAWENPNNASQTQMFEFGTKISQNITLVAKFRGKTWVKITLDPNGGTFDADAQVELLVATASGNQIAEPNDKPTRIGYTFNGWFTEKECYNKFTFDVLPVENFTLYADWAKDTENFVYVTYYGNGEELRVDPVRKGEDVVLPDFFADDSDIVVGDWMIDNNPNKPYTAGKATDDLHLYVNYYTDGLEFNVVRTTATVTGYNGTATEVIVPSAYNGGTVTGIGSYAFYRTGQLPAITSIKLPDTIATIGEGAFYDCQYLVSVNLTSNVTSIGKNAFYRNTRLRSIGDITGVDNLGAGAFNGCKDLREITLGNFLTVIGDYTFNDCASLTKIDLSDALTEIGEYAFSGCTALTSIDLESFILESIANNAFADCLALTEVNIAKTSGEVVMQGNPFAGCRNVTVYVPSALLETYQNNTNNTQFKDKFATR